MVPQDMTIEEFRGYLFSLARAVTTQANRDVGRRVNYLENTITSRFRNILMTNQPTIIGSKV